MNDTEKIIEANDAQYLKHYSDEANKDIDDAIEIKNFLNLSLREIAENISIAINEILIEILDLRSITLYDILLIITKKDRMIYMGIVIFMISLCLIFI